MQEDRTIEMEDMLDMAHRREDAMRDEKAEQFANEMVRMQRSAHRDRKINALKKKKKIAKRKRARRNRRKNRS